MPTQAIVRQDRHLPHVQLFDANELDLDDQSLRILARELTTSSGAPYVSRSYAYPYALVAWHSSPVGVDIEHITPCDSAFADLICTRDERLEASRLHDDDRFLVSLWTSKEAIAKGLGDAVRYEPTRLDAPSQWPLRQAGTWCSEELAVKGEYVAWICWRSGDFAFDNNAPSRVVGAVEL